MASSTTDRRLGLTGGTAIKAPCVCATTGNITLFGAQTIDGVSVGNNGERVLVWQQTDTTANGIYVSDTGAWTRDLDADGNNDLRKGTLVRVNSGNSYSATLFSLASTDPITMGTSGLVWSREALNTTLLSSQSATFGQTVFTVPSYQTNNNAISVFVNGVRRETGVDYTETNSSTITFIQGDFRTGDEVDFLVYESLGTLAAAAANIVTVTDANDYYVGTNVESILAEIAQGITADNGDASVTLTNNSSDRVQCWNTTLTVNRTVTLSTTSAKEGATFYIARKAGATGNFTLSVGSLATLRAPGEWCRVSYDAGTAAWVLVQYGILPSAEVLAMSADSGDASATLTVGTSERTQRWATTLTADRTATLATTTAYTGARFRITRTEASAGSFVLIVSASSVTLAQLMIGQWCDVEYSGSAWIMTGRGNIRTTNTGIITLYDDFLGEEISGYWWQSLIGTDASCKNALVRSEQLRGFARLTTGAGAGATMAVNGVQLNSRLNWQANQGGLKCEFTLKMDVITSVAVFAGFTNQDSAVQIPINGSGAVDGLTNNANDAVGILFDTTMTTKNWWLVGVSGGVGATAQNSAIAPIAATVETWRIDLSATGVATFYRNGTLIGTAMTGAVTNNVPLTPVVAAFARTGTSRNIDIDAVFVEAQR